MLCYAMMRHAALNPRSCSTSLSSHPSDFLIPHVPFFRLPAPNSILWVCLHFLTLGESTFTPCALSHTLALTLAGILRPLNL